MELKPYQQEAVNRIKESYQLILADEMGLGKTATILKGVEHVAVSGRRVLVVCPASLKLNWCKEIKTWLGYDITPDQYTQGRITVTNYERLNKCEPLSHRRIWDTVIFDEAHYLKNPESQRHRKAVIVANNMNRVFLLTGTPMVSGPCDLAAELEVLGLLELFGGYKRFYERYCSPTPTGYGYDYSGSCNQQELQKKLKQYIIRRTKKECGIILPQKQIIDVPVVEVNQPHADSLQIIERQQQQVNTAKFPYAVKFIDNLLQQGKRPVVFVHHKALMRKLMNIYADKAVNIYGGQDMYLREEAVRRFQLGKVPLIFCSLQASATGITLTSSDTAVFLEYLWSPSVSEQAQDRIHRLSQTRDVTVYNLYCPGSIEVQKDIRSYVKKLDMEGIL